MAQRDTRSLATIGVYGFNVDAFLAALNEAGVGLVLDVRQRRGVRGSQYAWANSKRLQLALLSAGIDYEHHRELAPTTAPRPVSAVSSRSRPSIPEISYAARWRPAPPPRSSSAGSPARSSAHPSAAA